MKKREEVTESDLLLVHDFIIDKYDKLQNYCVEGAYIVNQVYGLPWTGGVIESEGKAWRIHAWNMDRNYSEIYDSTIGQLEFIDEKVVVTPVEQKIDMKIVESYYDVLTSNNVNVKYYNSPESLNRLYLYLEKNIYKLEQNVKEFKEFRGDTNGI